jgi:hypothetical protein
VVAGARSRQIICQGTDSRKEGRLDPATGEGTPLDPRSDVVRDLVGYVIVVVPDRDSLSEVVPALADLVEAGAIRILDLVVLDRDGEEPASVLEFEEIDSLHALADLEGDVGGLLSEHDIEMASLALPSGTSGIVLVTEDRWAEPLSSAARRAGGRIVAGERIAPARVEAALADHADDMPREGG